VLSALFMMPMAAPEVLCPPGRMLSICAVVGKVFVGMEGTGKVNAATAGGAVPCRRWVFSIIEPSTLA
jgi:hypothetical protein